MKSLEFQSENSHKIGGSLTVTDEELTARLLSEYLVKEGVVYENAGSFETNGSFVITLKKIEDDVPYQEVEANETGNPLIEYRVWNDVISQRRLVKKLECANMGETLPKLLLSKPLSESKSYKHMSLEYDEDRNVFIIYMGE
jgi:hypothetical protein